MCLCLFSLIDFPLFNLEFSWAVVSRGGAVTQTGWRKVGSLCLINTVSHMSSEVPRIFMQDPSLPSVGPHRFPEDGRNTASFVFTASHALLGSRLRTSVVRKSLSSQPPRTTGRSPAGGRAVGLSKGCGGRRAVSAPSSLHEFDHLPKLPEPQFPCLENGVMIVGKGIGYRSWWVWTCLRRREDQVTSGKPLTLTNSVFSPVEWRL